MQEVEISIEHVKPGSIADELGIKKGDRLLSVNGERPKDLIDYRFLCAEDQLEIEVLKEDGEVWACEIEKDYDEDLGIGFASDTFDGIRSCANKCVFCFVDQMPPEMRESLYVKDDDYRLSFLHGNFVTLTNLSDKDFERILRMHLSPLYISVHCTNPELRVKMLGSKNAGRIMEQLHALAQAGIDMHTQVVLCPGLNDGRELERTIKDLSGLWPFVRSIAIVPVGLTRHRDSLFNLRKFTVNEAKGLINLIDNYQDVFLKHYENPLVYLGDEFYVLAGEKFPPAARYGGYPQLENGIGLVRLFYNSFAEVQGLLPKTLAKSKRLALVTGVSGQYVLGPVVDRLNQIKNLQVELIGVRNGFFGENVTVAGLLTGRDVIEAIREKLSFDEILLPSVMCKRDEPVFLDGQTPEDIEKVLGIPVRIIDIDQGAKQLVEAILN